LQTGSPDLSGTWQGRRPDTFRPIQHGTLLEIATIMAHIPSIPKQSDFGLLPVWWVDELRR
jgi:hypothetical protein